MKKLFLATLACCATTIHAYELTLHVTNAQVGQLIIGCDTRATDGHDRGLDIFAPPMGMGSGIVGITPQAGERQKPAPDLYYKDMRADHYPQTWNLSCQIFKKPMTFTWSPDAFPQGITFTIRQNGGKVVDMRTKNRFSMQKTGVLTITALPAQVTPEATRN